MSNQPAATPPAQDPAEKTNALRTRWETLHQRSLLPNSLAVLERLDKNVAGLETDIAALRARGYRYSRGWEERARAIKRQWPAQRLAARRLFDEESKTLQKKAQDIGNLLTQAARSPAIMVKVEQHLDTLEPLVASAEARIKQAVGVTEDGIGALEKEVQQAVFLLDHLDSAQFKLYPDEEGVAACRAQWLKGREEPEGILFLTNQRLLFEQREDKAAKKVLFITTQKEMVQEMLWQAPVGAVATLSAEDKGGFLGFGVKETLTLEFADNARDIDHTITLRFKDNADNEGWQSLIRRVQSGQIESERHLAAGQAPAAHPAPLPTACPACGAKLPAIFKGMRQIECEFCHTMVSLPA